MSMLGESRVHRTRGCKRSGISGKRLLSGVLRGELLDLREGRDVRLRRCARDGRSRLVRQRERTERSDRRRGGARSWAVRRRAAAALAALLLGLGPAQATRIAEGLVAVRTASPPAGNGSISADDRDRIHLESGTYSGESVRPQFWQMRFVLEDVVEPASDDDRRTLPEWRDLDDSE